jgi:hypothetical protein
MDYRRSVEVTLRDAVQNPLGLLWISLAFSVALVPFSATVFFAIPFAWLAGLWTSCLLCGVVLVAGFRLMTEIAVRHESISTMPFWEGVRHNWRDGLAIGVGTFAVLLVAVLLFSVPLSGIFGQSINLLGVYLVIGWIHLLAFSLPVYARIRREDATIFSIQTVRFAFVTGMRTLLQNPKALLWLFVQSLGWSFIALITIITPVLLLPGFLTLLAVEIVVPVTPWDELSVVATTP